MFVKHALIKNINEEFFKGYKNAHPDLCNLDKDPTVGEITDNLEILISIKMDDTEFAAMHFDLLHYEDRNFKSMFAKELEVTRKVYSEKVKRALPLVGVTAEVVELLRKLSSQSCLVGGSVRDAVLGQRPKDFDFTTDVPYDTLVWKFTEAGFKVKETGKNFLVMIVSKGGEDFEIANFRKDGTYEDGRRPESVDIGTLDDDAQRRDFTVNALYFRLSDNLLLDPSGQGIPDVKERVLRFVGKPEDRLNEDSLRAFRFYRFLSRGFTAAPKDLRAVRTLFKEAYTRTDPARVMQEIEKMIGV